MGYYFSLLKQDQNPAYICLYVLYIGDFKYNPQFITSLFQKKSHDISWIPELLTKQ